MLAVLVTAKVQLFVPVYNNALATLLTHYPNARAAGRSECGFRVTVTRQSETTIQQKWEQEYSDLFKPWPFIAVFTTP